MKAKSLLLLVATLLSVAAFSQSVWSPVDAASVKSFSDASKNQLPLHYRLFKLDRAHASQVQRQASTASPSDASIKQAVQFGIPMPDGQVINTALFASDVLSEDLQKANPSIKTYQLIDPVNNTTVSRLTATADGFSGIILTEQGTAYVYPLGKAFPDIHLVYYLKDLPVTVPVGCGVREDLSNLRASSALASDGKKRTFRLAIAATGEYTTWAGSQANALAYITTTVNDVNTVYERDATIHFTLVSNNSIIFASAAGDPYPTVAFPDGTTLANNQSTLVSNIGSGNFDLGMVFNNGWNGGLASLSVVCNNSFKGQGAAGLNFGTGANPTAGPQGPIFASTVAHEIGHQFSATHTHSATNGQCGGGNINAPTAIEPGGGSTIMAYAGSCTGNYYQAYSDLYFHANSIALIQAYATSGSASCTTAQVIANTPPAVTVPAASYNVPASTPFTLRSTGTDADGNILKYTWEQMDAGTSAAPPAAASTSGPNFRSYPPSTASARTFPSMTAILAGNSPTYEVLSSATRNLNFRVTVRDEAAGGGATAQADVAVNVSATAGPFAVTSQNTATSWTSDGVSTAAITWNVANSTAAPVSCSNVDILFSTDGGQSFPYTLAANTANDGTETIVIPNLPTQQGRIKIQASNNIFFNVNAATITVSSICSADGTTYSPASNVSANAGNASLDLTLNPMYGNVLVPAGQLASTDPTANLAVRDSVSNGPQVFGNVFQYDSYTFYVNKAGTYTFTLGGGAPGSVVANLYTDAFNASNVATNFLASSGYYGDVSGFVYLSNKVVATLAPNRAYVLTVGTFNTNSPALPANYSVAVSGVAGGNIYDGIPNPGAGFSYTYVIVNNATGIIKAIDPSSDLSNSSNYPSGTYTVYGLSYSNSISAATLNAYVGGAFSTLTSDLLFKANTVCGSLSKNSLVASINSSLPVKLLPLRGYKSGTTSVQLKWATASELHNHYFEIQRSADGASFNTALGKLPGKDYSQTLTDYNFTDNAPLAGWNYYRLKQVDLDGTVSYSNVVKVDFAGSYRSVLTYPNPAGAILNVEYFSETAATVNWSILDSHGAVVKQSSFKAQPGTVLQQLQVATLPAGVYVLRTVDRDNVQVSRFIKQ